MKEFIEFFDPRIHPELAAFTSQTLVRLIVAAFLGGTIGLERETKRKAAGLRTNMFICFGAAMFTVLSDKLATNFGGDHTRIAAKIIPGIGFIGAGSILHSKGGISGLTTAATLFVVASIGMAAGGGLMITAMFATLLLLLALRSLGWAETRWNLKPQLMSYELHGVNTEGLLATINEALEEEHKAMHSVQVGRLGEESRIMLTVEGFAGEHARLMSRLRTAQGVSFFECLTCGESE
jgi:putative Mg2+ transporter-C (MgtC) family protein